MAPKGRSGSDSVPTLSKFSYCGPAPDHCDCVGCVDYRGGAPKVNPLLVGRVRQDRRCGAQFPLDDGSPSECDGAGENPCCSKWGYCGPGADHCECEGCTDYRTADQRGQSEHTREIVYRHGLKKAGPKFGI